jgi:hypothetical protein
VTRATDNELILCIFVVFASTSADAAESFSCSVNDVVELTAIGTMSRRPALTQAEMSLHPTFRIDTATGALQSTQTAFNGTWAKLGSTDFHRQFATTDFVVSEAPDQPSSQLLRIFTAKPPATRYFFGSVRLA